MQTDYTIGIVGGVGPYAGLDLNKKIFDQTVATTDQEHLSVVLISCGREIADRTAFLQGRSVENPAPAIVDVILKLESVGASVVGIPCNTAHAAPIFDVITAELEQRRSRVNLIHMPEQVGRWILTHHPGLKKLGILSTTGTCQARIYDALLASQGLEAVSPAKEIQDTVQSAIYSIKAQSDPVKRSDCEILLQAVDHLVARGAQAIILGCTELPLAIREANIGPIPVIDPTLVLARSMIGAADPNRLKPLPNGPLDQ